MLCEQDVETTNHVLFSCKRSCEIWSACYKWWGITTITQEGGWEHFMQHVGLAPNGKLQAAWNIVWFAIIWSIWLWRNQKVCKEGQGTKDTVIELIKFRSFNWLKAKIKTGIQYDI
ncbi:hypothetical protein SLA2020_491950 [Shorea laevis]